MGSLTSSAWAMAPSLVAFVQSTGPRAGEPPPTSGNGMTLLLGLTASSLLVVVVGAWLLRGMRALLATLRGDDTDRVRERPPGLRRPEA